LAGKANHNESITVDEGRMSSQQTSKSKLFTQILFIISAVCMTTVCFGEILSNNSLKSMQLSSLENNRTQLQLGFQQAAPEPLAFSMENPARLVLDFAAVKNALPKEQLNTLLDTGVIKRIQTVEAQNKTRVILELTRHTAYETKKQNNHLFVTLTNAKSSNLASNTNQDEPFHSLETAQLSDNIKALYTIKNIDFKRGDKQEGRVIIELSDKKAPIDLKQKGNLIYVKFMDAKIKESLQRKLDVTDFGTPIKSISTRAQSNSVEMIIESVAEAEHIAYQTDKRFTIEVRELTRQEKEQAKSKQANYTGERLSLNFQEIDVRAVLQLIADFTGLNVVTSDSVKGSVTLRLRNVPWDQALDIIMKSKGLDKRQEGNVLMIGTAEELSARERLDLQNSQQVSELAPLRSEYIQVNNAKASDLAKLLKDEKASLLSPKGNVTVDDRTNTLLILDTVQKIQDIRKLLVRLDVPVRQVLIESRLVYVTDTFEKAFGVKLGSALKFRPGNEPRVGFTGNRVQSNNIAGGASPSTVSVADRLNVDLGPADVAKAAVTSGFGLTVAALPGGTMLDLELRAMESEGLSTVLASPRLITSNQQMAHIEAGEEIPYQEASSSGATSVSFKKAVLKLEVTPQITPDDNIILDLKVNQDSKGDTVGGVPAINTREVQTKVLVANGETVVLGGIYQQEKSKTVNRIPVLGRLPGIGWMFRNKYVNDSRNELMVFVTPKIIEEKTMN
jgi:type IV pilus assembly protein PilQ